MFASEIDPAKVSEEDRAAGDEAFELLRANAAALVGPGGDEMTTALAFWSLSHGLSMLIIDGRIPPEHVGSPEAIEALARAVFCQ